MFSTTFQLKLKVEESTIIDKLVLKFFSKEFAHDTRYLQLTMDDNNKHNIKS